MTDKFNVFDANVIQARETWDDYFSSDSINCSVRCINPKNVCLNPNVENFVPRKYVLNETVVETYSKINCTPASEVLTKFELAIDRIYPPGIDIICFKSLFRYICS